MRVIKRKTPTTGPMISAVPSLSSSLFPSILFKSVDLSPPSVVIWGLFVTGVVVVAGGCTGIVGWTVAVYNKRIFI